VLLRVAPAVVVATKEEPGAGCGERYLHSSGDDFCLPASLLACLSHRLAARLSDRLHGTPRQQHVLPGGSEGSLQEPLLPLTLLLGYLFQTATSDTSPPGCGVSRCWKVVTCPDRGMVTTQKEWNDGHC
jgi:hypothetical protein